MTAGPIQHVALASVAVGAVALLVLLPRVFLRTDPVLRYRLLAWFLPVAVLALPAQVAVTALAPEWARLRLRPRADAQPRVQHWSTWLRAVDVDLDDHTPARAASPDGRAAAPEAETVESAQPGLLPRFLNALPAIYITGVILALVILVARLRKTLRVMRRCRPVADEDTLTLWNEVVGEFGMRNRVRLLECEGLSAPACWGPWRPVVIVPTTDDTAIDKRLLSCALRHELIHLRRRDPLHKLLQLLLMIGFWFHPLVWLYCLALDRDRELSCDALVVRKTRKPRTYALALLAYCERATHPARITPCAAFGSIVKLQKRLDMIRHAQPRSKRIWTRLMLGGVLLGIAGISAAHMTMAAAMNSNRVATPPRADLPSRPDKWASATGRIARAYGPSAM